MREVSFSLGAETAIQELARSRGSTITIIDCRELNKREMTYLVDIESPNGDSADVISDLKAKGIFKEVYAGESKGPTRSLCVAVLDKPAVCKAALGSGGFCVNCANNRKDADEGWKVLLRDSGQLKGLLSRLEAGGLKASVRGISTASPPDALTLRQKEILSKAISLGYFEFPRRTSLTDLSKQVGIKPSTLSQILRAAEGKIISKYAEDMKISQVRSQRRASQRRQRSARLPAVRAKG